MITSFRISLTFYLQDNRLQIFLSICTCNIFRSGTLYINITQKIDKVTRVRDSLFVAGFSHIFQIRNCHYSY